MSVHVTTASQRLENCECETRNEAKSPVAETTQASSERTSQLLLRDVMDSLGRGSKGRILTSGMIAMSGHAFKVDEAILDSHLREINDCALVGIACRKLWQSICPMGLSVILTYCNRTIPTSAWFKNHIINDVWAKVLERMMWSIISVGYAAWTYSASPDHPDTILPTILDPQQYNLKWTVDQHGNKYPFVVPRNLPKSPMADGKRSGGSGESLKFDYSGGTQNFWTENGMARDMFEAADVYVDTWPSDTGEINSRTRKCIFEIVRFSALQNDLMVSLNTRANAPMVTTSQPADVTASIPQDQRIRSTVPTAMLSHVPPAIANRSLADAMSTRTRIDIADFSARYNAATSVIQTATGTTIEQAIDRASDAPFRKFNRGSRLVEEGDPVLPWRNAQLKLPPGVSVGSLQLPEIPRVVINDRDMLISVICSALECPTELVLGTVHARTTTSIVMQEALATSISAWRSNLTRRAEFMYWRIYGEKIVTPIANELHSLNIPLTRKSACEIVSGLNATFTFQSRNLSSKDARELYRDGIISRVCMHKAVMREYGLQESDMMSASECSEQLHVDVGNKRSAPAGRTEVDDDSGVILDDVVFEDDDTIPTKKSKKPPLPN